MRIGIIWGTPYASNLGVSALTYSALALIHDVQTSNMQNHSILLIGTGKWNRDVISIGDYNIEIENIGSLNILKNIKLSIKNNLISKLMNLDLILDIGAGDSFSDIYGQQRFDRFLNSKRIFHFLKRKQILLPQTIGPFSSKENEKKAFKILTKLELIMCRDKQSYDYCSKFLSKDIILECIDLAFYLPYKKIEFDRNVTHIGINLSGLLWNGGYTRDNQFNLKLDYQVLMRKIINYFHNKNSIQIHLIGHVININDQIGVEDDYVVCELLKNEFPNIIIAPKFKNPIEAKNYISGMDFFIGARMHSCIAAFSSGVVTYPLSYSRKFNGLFKDTLDYKWMGDCVNENLDDVMNGMIDTFSNRNVLKDKITLSHKLIVEEKIILLKQQLKTILKRINENRGK